MDLAIRNEIISNHGPLISSSMASIYKKNSTGIVSVEDSGPPSPTSGPVINFAEVAPGIYRSSFPMNGNFDHLRSLRLKTILTLVPEEYPAQNVVFMKENGIQHIQIAIPAHKNESVTIPLESIANALDILRNPEQHPVLVHCNKGKHRTGCIIAAYRLLSHCSLAATITEYRKYAASKARALDEAFIRNFNIHSMLALLNGGAKPSLLLTPPASDTGYDNRSDDDGDWKGW